MLKRNKSPSLIVLFFLTVGLLNSCTFFNGKEEEQNILNSSLLLPAKNTNNVWYPTPQSENDTVVVFVHGILGDSRGTWLYENDADPRNYEYWPRLMSEDQHFQNVSIFLGGYSTEFDSLQYDGKQAARELFSALKYKKGILPSPEKNEIVKSVMEHKNILFVTHSTGGIIVRYMLYHEREAFKDKTVGIALIASPSYGSKWANRLTPLLEFYGNKLGKQLKWGSDFLDQLDDNFKELVWVERKKLPYLVGQEALEQHFIIHSKWFFPNRSLVVEKESGAQYFPSPKVLPGTDHFSTVKPNDRTHPGYDFVLTFFLERFKPLIFHRAHLELNKLIVQPDGVKSLKEKFESTDDYPHHKLKILKEAEPLAERILLIKDEELLIGGRIDKYRYAALCLLMGATFDPNQNKRNFLGEKAREYAEKTLNLIEELTNLPPDKKGYHVSLKEWVREYGIKDYLLHLKTIALAILAQTSGSSVTPEMVRQTYDLLSSGFKEEYPFESNPDLKKVLNK